MGKHRNRSSPTNPNASSIPGPKTVSNASHFSAYEQTGKAETGSTKDYDTSSVVSTRDSIGDLSQDDDSKSRPLSRSDLTKSQRRRHNRKSMSNKSSSLDVSDVASESASSTAEGSVIQSSTLPEVKETSSSGSSNGTSSGKPPLPSGIPSPGFSRKGGLNDGRSLVSGDANGSVGVSPIRADLGNEELDRIRRASAEKSKQQEDRIDSLVNQMAEMQLELERNKMEHAELENLKNVLAAKDLELQQKSEYENAKSEITQKNHLLLEQLSQLEAMESLKELVTLKDSQLQQAAADMERDAADLRLLEKLKKQVEDFDSRWKDHEAFMQNAEVMKQTKDDIEKICAAQLQEITVLKERAAEKEAMLRNVFTQVDSLHEQVKSKEGDLRRYSEVSQENNDLRHKIGELEALIARDSASEDENGSLQQEIAAMILEHQKIVQENRDLQQAVSEQRMLISESAESKAQAQNLREMLRKAESELSTIDAEVSRLRAEPPPNVLIELEELRQKVGDGLGNEKETLKRKLKEMESANDRSLIRLRQLDEISRSNAQLEKRLSDEKHRNEALEAQLLATSRDSLELQEIERLHDTIQQNKKQLKEQSAAHRFIEETLEAQRETVARHNARTLELEAQCASLTLALDEEKERNFMESQKYSAAIESDKSYIHSQVTVAHIGGFDGSQKPFREEKLLSASDHDVEKDLFGMPGFRRDLPDRTMTKISEQEEKSDLNNTSVEPSAEVPFIQHTQNFADNHAGQDAHISGQETATEEVSVRRKTDLASPSYSAADAASSCKFGDGSDNEDQFSAVSGIREGPFSKEMRTEVPRNSFTLRNNVQFFVSCGASFGLGAVAVFLVMKATKLP